MSQASTAIPSSDVLATSAPIVESAEAKPAIPCESVSVEDAPSVEPATVGGGVGRESGLDRSDDDGAYSKKYSKHKVFVNTSVESLRLNSYSHFEGYAAVLPAVKKQLYQKILPFLYERNFIPYGEARRFLVIKHDICFVFLDDVSTSPLFTFSVDNLVPKIEDVKNPDPNSTTISPIASSKYNASGDTYTTILLRVREENKRHTKLAYQVSFEKRNDSSEDTVQNFLQMFKSTSNYEKTDVVAVAVTKSDIEKKR